MILTQTPKPDIHAWELENALNVIKKHVRKSKSWQFREEYIDRGILDPYYILMIRQPEDDKLDDVWNQKVLKSSQPGFSYVHRTSKCSKDYWCDINIRDLVERLDLFKESYDLNRLQPPGLKGDLFVPRDPHQIFEKKRYIYELLTPFKSLTGIGPSMYAMGPGAVCGTVYDVENRPLDGADVELKMGEEVLKRTTKNGGLFWFSKIPAGTYKVTVKHYACTIQVIRRDEFGNIKGWLTDQDGYPVEYADVHFKAPDNEIFKTTTDETGKFTTGPLPAFPVRDTPLSNYPYLMDVPDFLFSSTKSVVVKDAVIGGVLRNQKGRVMTGQVVILKQSGEEVSRTTTDAHGNFQFFELVGGTYVLEVPESTIYLSHLPPGKVVGKYPMGDANQTRVELIMQDKVITTERLSRDKAFHFDKVTPGTYEVIFKETGED
ncbi:carboxypeptidase regulatory-like domain-containing protein [Ekhidna sp.]|uniref:carboxypeptidase regulatory-like domain-containing protein n=1 Tax=Ekhidna sp. TaxID=2608089 RepID=UPI003BABA624